MKTIRLILTSILFLVAIATSAQCINIYKNGIVIKSYSIAEVDSVEYSPTPQAAPTRILIGDITVGQEIGDELFGDGDPKGFGEYMTKAQNVASILTDAIIQQNIDDGNLKEMNLEDVLSIYNNYTQREDYVKYSFATKKFILLPTHNIFTYHAILIPKSISDEYLACWIDGAGVGYSFDYPSAYWASVVDKTISFNGENYSMSGYYVDMTGENADYYLTIVKKNQ